MEERDKESIQEIVLEDSKDKETKIGRGDQRAGKLHEKLLRDVGTPLTYQVRRGERSSGRSCPAKTHLWRPAAARCVIVCVICGFVIFANYHLRTFNSDVERRTVSGDKNSSCQGENGKIQSSWVWRRMSLQVASQQRKPGLSKSCH